MHKAKSHKTMNWVLHSSFSVPPALWSGLSRMLTPSVLLIIVILTITFFLSDLLHLIVRLLMSLAATRYTDDSAEDGITALDQSFIDAIPVFVYKAIIRSRNDPLDCAVCLCEFEPEDVLRLIPKCCHAFHMECIDTWLLSHSTCPFCRANLLHDGLSSKDGNYKATQMIHQPVFLQEALCLES